MLAIQTKRTTTTILTFLDRAELDALLAAPDTSTWHGRRDHALLVLAAQTGLRVSELTGLLVHDAHLAPVRTCPAAAMAARTAAPR